MDSTSKGNTKLFQLFIVLVLIAGALFPPVAIASAQDEVPPAETETGGEETPADPAEEPEAPVELPAEATVESPLDPTEELPVEPAPTEGLLVEATVEVPLETTPVEEVVPVETVAEVVELLNESNTILVGENGEEIPLTSVEAAEALQSVDPFFQVGSGSEAYWVGYTTAGGVCPQPVSLENCNQVTDPTTTPLASALADSRLVANATLYIEGSTSSSSPQQYDETVTISKNINLTGVEVYDDSGTWRYQTSTGYANINTVYLTSELGTITRVTATNIFVIPPAGMDDDDSGDMLRDALNLIAETGTIDLAAGIYEDDDDDFDMDKDGVTLQGAGSGTVIDGNNYGSGIDVNADYVTVRKLKVMGCGHGTGIRVDGDHTTLDDVISMGNAYGVRLGDDSDYTAMTQMNLVNNDFGLLGGIGSDTASIHFSNILGNSHYGIYNHSDHTINATSNYWGHASGPTKCWMNYKGKPECDPTVTGDKVFANKTFTWDTWVDGQHYIYIYPLNVRTGSALPTVCDDSDPTTNDVLNADGACSHSPAQADCENGFNDADTNGTCETSGCTNGNTDFDHNGTCESSGCLPRTHDSNSDGVCVPSNCPGGYNDMDSDGVCQQTNCPQGYSDGDSDGSCEIVEPDGTDGPVLPLGPFVGGGADGAGLVIPVTGGLMTGLSCTDANTLMLASGNSVAFSAPLCGFDAGLTEEAGDSLPAPLPDGYTFISGMTLNLQKSGTDFGVLPEPVTSTLKFGVPEDLAGKTLAILFWDAAANGGLGAWVEVPSDAPGLATLNYTGTFVLAYK
ncbi:MAG: hypothetical protein AB9891_21895 [Anaerolineaceae bacterium]